jgi:ketosteroid isomerase-like protein
LPDSAIIPPDAPVSAQPHSAQDAIKAQLSAIRARDADAAYALMTKDFHKEHPDALAFFAKMRFDKRAIYNHEEYTFLDTQGTGPVTLQKVRMNDHYGSPVTVIYRLEQQADGHWLIDSFTILKIDAQPI